MAGLITDELSLVNALRARREELNVTYDEIDRIGDLPEGYASKVLAWPPIKNMGIHSFWIVASALGFGIQLVVNPAAEQRFSSKMDARDRKWVRKRLALASSRIPWLITANNARELGLIGAKKANARRSPRMRSKLARYAAKVRWANRGASEKAP